MTEDTFEEKQKLYARLGARTSPGRRDSALITTETPEGASEEASRIRAEEQSDALSTGADIACAGFEG